MQDGQFEERGNHFVLKGGNGEVVGTSEEYEGHLRRAADDFKVAALTAIAAEIEEYEGDPEASEAAKVLRKVAARYRGEDVPA
jgi:hypothetical protein